MCLYIYIDHLHKCVRHKRTYTYTYVTDKHTKASVSEEQSEPTQSGNVSSVTKVRKETP